MNDNQIVTTRNRIIELLNQLTGGPTLEWYEDTIQQIRSLDQDLTRKILRELLTNSDKKLRMYAGEVLLRIAPALELMSILELLKDLDADIRYNTTRLLANYPDERACEELIRVLLNDPDPDVRSNAVIALRNIGNDKAVKVIEWASANDFGTDFQGETISTVAKRAIVDIKQRRV